jgi:nucleoside-diphosphate-sugar epimerase
VRVILAGATGAVGAPVARALLAAGHHVIGLSRTQNGMPEEVQLLTADALEHDSLLRAARGIRADAVIHQMTALKKPPMRHRDMALTNRLRVEGTANLVALARQVGATRFLTQSMIFGYGYGDLGDQPITEAAPFGRDGRGGFAAHLQAMRSNEEQAFAIGGIALRYGIFYGAADDPTIDLVRRGRLPVPKGGTISRIHVEDAATATVAALEHGRPGQAYNIVDDLPAGWRDYYCAVAEAHGAPAPKAIPAWLLKATPYLHAIFTATCRISNARAKSELGWTPSYPTYREGIAPTI